MPDRRDSSARDELLERLAGIDQNLAVLTSKFETVQTVVFGLVGSILLAVLGALLAFVLKGKGL